MADYQELYFKLFNRITDVIHELEAMQVEAEEAFISQEEEGQGLPRLLPEMQFAARAKKRQG